MPEPRCWQTKWQMVCTPSCRTIGPPLSWPYTVCACFSIPTRLFGLTQVHIKWGALLCDLPPERAVEGVPTKRVEWHKPKMTNLQEPCSPSTEQYAKPAKMRMQPKALECSCAQIRCRSRRSGARSCLTCQQRTGTNCAIEVSQVDLDGYILYKRNTTTQRDYLPCFIARQVYMTTSQCLWLYISIGMVTYGSTLYS